MGAYFGRSFFASTYFGAGYWGPGGGIPPVGADIDYLMFARRISRR